MNKRKKMFLGIIGAVSLFSIVHMSAEVPQGGSAADPLVTKSYVDAKFAEMTKLVSSVIEPGKVEDTNKNTPNEEGTVSMGYQPIGPIEAGQVIFGGEGTEIILRGGKAKAVCPGENGLSDLTAGSDIANDVDIPLNHLLVIPRRDGRGIRIEETAYIMVRGEIIYE